jgi:hypothetical protein
MPPPTSPRKVPNFGRISDSRITKVHEILSEEIGRDTKDL